MSTACQACHRGQCLPGTAGHPSLGLSPQVAGLCLVSHLAASGCLSTRQPPGGTRSCPSEGTAPIVTDPESLSDGSRAVSPPPTDPSPGGLHLPVSLCPAAGPISWGLLWRLTSEPQAGLLRAQAVGQRGEPLGNGGQKAENRCGSCFSRGRSGEGSGHLAVPAALLRRVPGSVPRPAAGWHAEHGRPRH